MHFILIDGDGCSPPSTNPRRCVHQVSSRVVSMALSPAEDLLALSLSSNQIMSISLSQADAKDDTVFAPVGAGGPPPGGDSRLVGHVCMCACVAMCMRACGRGIGPVAAQCPWVSWILGAVHIGFPVSPVFAPINRPILRVNPFSSHSESAQLCICAWMCHRRFLCVFLCSCSRCRLGPRPMVPLWAP